MESVGYVHSGIVIVVIDLVSLLSTMTVEGKKDDVWNSNCARLTKRVKEDE